MRTLVGGNRVKLDGEVISTLAGGNEVSVNLLQVILSTEGLELAKALPGEAQSHRRLVLEVGNVEENSIKVGELDVNGIGLLIRAAVSFEKKKKKKSIFYSTIFKNNNNNNKNNQNNNCKKREWCWIERIQTRKRRKERERLKNGERKIIKVDFFFKKDKKCRIKIQI